MMAVSVNKANVDMRAMQLILIDNSFVGGFTFLTALVSTIA
jgi:hypothetical protein